jgi:hypothetical protein
VINMKIKKRSWEIESERVGEIEIKGTGQGLTGGRQTTVVLSSLTLTETSPNGEKRYDGTFETENDSRLDSVGQQFRIILSPNGDEAPPFRELRGCGMIGLRNTRTSFMASEVIWE